MRGKVILSLLAVACVGAAWLYLSPDTLSKAQQMIGVKQIAASDKAATDKQAAGGQAAGGQAAGGKQGAGGNGARSASIVSATATTADFPIRRYAIGFVSSPAVVNINAR